MLFHLWLGSYHTQIDFHPIFMPFFIIGPDTRIHTQNMVIADFGANINSDTDIMSVEKDGLPIIWKQLAIRLSLFKQIVPKLSDMLVKMMQNSPFFLSPSIFFFLSRKKKVSIENCLLFHGFILQDLRTTQIISDKILVRFLGFLNQVFWGSVSLGLHQNCQQTQPIVFYRWAENAQSQCLQTENGMEKIHSDLLVSCWCADVSGTVETMLQS